MKKFMKKIGVLLLAGILLCNAACFKVPTQVLQGIINNEEQQQQQGDLDTVIRYIPDSKPDLKDDFFASINYDVLKEQKIPSGNSTWNVLGDISLWIAVDLYKMTLDLQKNQGTYEKGTPEQKIADFSTLIADYDGRNAESINEIHQVLSGIESARNIEEYITELGDFFITYGFSSTIHFDIDADSVDSTRNACWIDIPDLVLQKEIYMDPDMEDTRKLYKNYMKDMFRAYGYTEEKAETKMEKVFAIQSAVAEQSLSADDNYNPEKYYNPLTKEGLYELLPGMDVDLVLKSFQMDQAKEWIVSDLGAVSKMGEYFTEENLETLKDFTTFIMLNDTSTVGTIEMRNLSVQFSMDRYGASGFPLDEDLDADLLQRTMSWEYGKLYVQEHFSEEMKEDIEDMIHEIIATYEKRIDKQDWMIDETKAKAKKKLETMNLKIGYPDKWPETLELYEVTPASEGGLLIRNYLEILKASVKDLPDKLNKPFDREVWGMVPQEVNAYYSPNLNEIVFPAGVLQEPLYSKDNTRAENFGGIGMVIGHEISHAFDDNGSLYDELGNYNVWWTDEEREEFQRLQKDIIDYYDNFELYDGNYINGKLTLSENTADLGALQCITQIVGPDQSDLRDMYKQFAKIWAQVDTKEFMLSALKTDTHAHAKARVNAVLSCTDGFYYAFGVKNGDEMYIPKEKRVGIW